MVLVVFDTPLLGAAFFIDPLAVRASRLFWGQIDEALAPKFKASIAQAKSSKAKTCLAPPRLCWGRPHQRRSPQLPICLMASPLYLKHSFNLSDEELVVRWSENIVWQFFSGMVLPLK